MESNLFIILIFVGENLEIAMGLLALAIVSLQKKRKAAESDTSTSSSSPEMREESAPVAKKAKVEPKASLTRSSSVVPTGAPSSSNIRQFGLRVTAMGAAKAAGNYDNTNNPTCRDAFKSLFTSSQQEQTKDKTSKWITCNSYK